METSIIERKNMFNVKSIYFALKLTFDVWKAAYKHPNS